MPLVNKRVVSLGREPIPKFARKATLCQMLYSNGSEGFEEQTTIFNIACMCLYPRKAGRVRGNQIFDTPVSVTYWAQDTASGAGCIFGKDLIQVPQHAEWYTVSWFKLPQAQVDAAGPYPEDYFRVRWELAV
jgi:hypothetical protein